VRGRNRKLEKGKSKIEKKTKRMLKLSNQRVDVVATGKMKRRTSAEGEQV
jgi:hypothetical protein